ncbi:MAG TPA: extracellular solute-binding protein [Bacillus sp. (in: firmicutes)]|uniref:extracellular solute-binding protein n=1 Tax=Bacillus litorisediminis TaxID=2922713 RepID=UPI001FAC7F3E|nr:extracellular solute-binding protein [Bacillus litorisediminis]HWO75011.1 extracellular solute-binding protein [Bacillus sp. (in: firmicutes)]
MKMKLKTMSLMLVLVLGLGFLAACSNEGEQSEGNDEPAEDWKGTITIWDGPRWAKPDDPDENKFFWIEEKIAEFEAEHEGVNIELVQVPWAELPDKLGVSIAGQAWPDIAPVDISGSAVSIDHIEQGVIEPVDEFFTEEELADFYPNAIDAYTFDGKLYGIPNSMTVHAMLLNLDLFEERGVTPPENGEWTWEEFVDAAEKLTFDRDGDGTIDVYGFSTYILPGYYEAWPFFYMNGGQPLSDDLSEFTFDEPEAVEAIQALADLKLVNEAAPVSMGGADVGGTFQAWANAEQRTVAMEPWATWAITSAQTAYPTNFMVANYPTGSSGEPVTIGGVGGWTMFHQEDEGKKAMVAEFMKHISTTDEQFRMAQEYGIFPARISAAEKNPYADNPEMARAQEMSTQVVMLPRHPEWKKIDEAIQSELQLVFNGEKTAEQAMKDAEALVQDLLE